MTVKPTVVGGSVRIDLREVPEGSHQLLLEAPEAVLTLLGGEAALFRDLGLEATLTRQGSEYWVQGCVAGGLEASCDRCLTRFTRPIRAELDLTILVGNLRGRPRR